MSTVSISNIAQHIIAAKKAFRYLRTSFENLLNVNNKAVKLLQEYEPVDIRRSIQLLKKQTEFLEDLKKILKPVGRDFESFFQAIEKYNSNTFFYYCNNKALKSNASLELKTEFLLWLVNEIPRRPKEAGQFWSLCSSLLPKKLQSLDFNDKTTIEKALPDIRSFLNGRRKIHEGLRQLQLHFRLEKRLENLMKEIESKPDLFFCHHQYATITKEMWWLEQDLNNMELSEIRKNMESIYLNSLDLIISSCLKNHSVRIKAILCRIPAHLTRAQESNVDRLLKLLNELILKITPMNNKTNPILVQIHKVNLHIQYSEEEIVRAHSNHVDILLTNLNKALKECAEIKPKLITQDPDFEDWLGVQFESIFAFIKLKNIVAASKKCIEIKKRSRNIPKDEAQAERLKKICNPFVTKYGECIQSKNKDWFPINNLFKAIQDSKFFKIKVHPAKDPALVADLSEKILDFKNLLGNHKFNAAEPVGYSIERIARQLEGAASADITQLCRWIDDHQKEWLFHSTLNLPKFLHARSDSLQNIALTLLNQTDSREVSYTAARALGKAFWTIQKRIYDDPIKGELAKTAAVFWFNQAIKGNPAPAKVYNKLIKLYQVLGNHNTAVELMEKVWDLPPQPGYFYLILHLATHYRENNRPVDIIKLYYHAVVHPLIPESRESEAQLVIHMNMIQYLMRSNEYREGYNLLMNLLSLNEKEDHKSFIDLSFLFHISKIVALVLKIPEEIIAIPIDLMEKFCGVVGTPTLRSLCLQRVYNSALEENNLALVEEYKWKIIINAISLSKRMKRFLVVTVNGRHNDPTEEYISLIRQFPLDINAYFGLYNLYHRQQKIAEAEMLYAIMLALPLSEGDNAIKFDDPLEKILSHVSQQDNDPTNYCSIGNWFMNRGKYDLAEKLYDKAQQLDPHHIKALTYRGLLYNKTNRPVEARLCFETVLNLYSSLPKLNAHWCFNRLVFENTQYTWGEIDNDPFSNFSQIIKEGATEYHKEAKLMAAISCGELAELVPGQNQNYANRAVDLDPFASWPYYQRAQINPLPPCAVTDLQNAIVFSCGYHINAHKRLINLIKTGSVKDAVEIHLSLGREMFKMKRIEEALLYLEAAREMNFHDLNIQELLGDCYALQKRHQSAMHAYEFARCDSKCDVMRVAVEHSCTLPVYGPYFRESLERIRELFNQLKTAQIIDLAQNSSEPSPVAKLKRQEVLIKSQNLLNQCMHLFSIYFMKHANNNIVAIGFPIRYIEQRQTDFTPESLRLLLGQYKLSARPIYKFLKDTYEKYHKELENFIDQANSEKHVKLGEQVRRVKTVTHMNPDTTTRYSVFLDAKTNRNPVDELQTTIDLIGDFIPAILAFLDGRASDTLLRSQISYPEQAPAIWDHLISMGWIENSGKITDTGASLPIEGVSMLDTDNVFSYLKELKLCSPFPANLVTNFTLEMLCLEARSLAPAHPPSEIELDQSMEKLAAKNVESALQGFKQSYWSSFVTVKFWAIWHPKGNEIYHKLGDLYWEKGHRFEAMQAYKNSKIALDPVKEEIWDNWATSHFN